MGNSLDINIFSNEEFREAFSTADKDKSGFIEKIELPKLLEILMKGPCPEKKIVDDFFGFFDGNNDGRISYNEFTDGVEELKKKAKEDNENNKEAGSYTSWEKLQGDRNKHKKNAENTCTTHSIAMSTSEEIGREPQNNAVTVGCGTKTKQSCEETRYADELVKSGVYF